MSYIKRSILIIVISNMIQEEIATRSTPKLQEIYYPKSINSGFSGIPILNKVESCDNYLFCGYSNGTILQYKYNTNDHTYQFNFRYHPYQNTDVIDIDQFDSEVLLTCTHTEVTLFNITKQKGISLKGHQSSPIAVSAHPVSPYVISVSNSIIEHDVRMQKPINVNFITPPAYDIQFFPDGKEFILSGQPCRIGRARWIRTLLNGIGKASINSKYVVTNDMNGSISLWDWRQSQQLIQLNNIRNTENYQPIHFSMRKGIIKDILFFQDNGKILKYDILRNERVEHKLFDVGKNDNWKMITKNVELSTKSVILYQHNKAIMRIYDI